MDHAFRGVSQETRRKQNRPWRAMHRGKHLGYFQTFEEAKAARLIAETTKWSRPIKYKPFSNNAEILSSK